MKRKDLLKGLLSPGPSDQAPVLALPPQAPSTRVPSGAVRAMGLALGRLETDSRELDTLRKRVDSGQVVVELSADVVSPSFVVDRLSRTADPDFAALLESVRATGQQVPILVRPHPEEEGRYQVAYGHRRLAAAAELGRPVHAVVRRMSDAELVVAQGKENAERRNLSYIERALFVAELDEKGFERATVQAALAAHAADMTRYYAVARAVPRTIIEAIGPAPRAGRPRWLELSRLLEQPEAQATVQQTIGRAGFDDLGSDGRFQALIQALRSQAVSDVPATEALPDIVLHDAGVTPVLRIRQNADGLQIVLLPGAAPDLRDQVVESLQRLVLARSAED